MRPSSSRGAALPAVLLLGFLLTSVGGWLVAHAIWDQQMGADSDDHQALVLAADALGDALVASLGQVPDWSLLLAPGAPAPCPGQATAMTPPPGIALETSRLHAATATLSRWTAAETPHWRFLAECQAPVLQATWRGDPDQAPIVRAWIADDPDHSVVVAYDEQVAIHVMALGQTGQRASLTLTVRRYHPGAAPRIVAWRLG
jgi:hypothetical protein